MATQAFDTLVLDGDWWLGHNGLFSFVGFDSAMSVISAYIATFMVVFVVVGALLFVLGHYLHEEISTPWTELFSNSKDAIWFKAVWMLYGFRAWLVSRLNDMKSR